MHTHTRNQCGIQPAGPAYITRAGTHSAYTPGESCKTNTVSSIDKYDTAVRVIRAQQKHGTTEVTGPQTSGSNAPATSLSEGADVEVTTTVEKNTAKNMDVQVVPLSTLAVCASESRATHTQATIRTRGGRARRAWNTMRAAPAQATEGSLQDSGIIGHTNKYTHTHTLILTHKHTNTRARAHAHTRTNTH